MQAPTVRQLVLCSVAALVAAAASIGIDLLTHESWLTAGVALLLMLVSGALMFLLMQRDARGAGVLSVGATIPARLRWGPAYLVTLGSAVALTDWVHALTQSRMVEAAVAVAVSLSIAAVGARNGFPAYGDASRPGFTGSVRTTLRLQYVPAGVFALNLALMLAQRKDYGLGPLHEATIAAYMIVLPLIASFIYALRGKLDQDASPRRPLRP
jgi:hypothetical protein